MTFSWFKTAAVGLKNENEKFWLEGGLISSKFSTFFNVSDCVMHWNDIILNKHLEPNIKPLNTTCMFAVTNIYQILTKGWKNPTKKYFLSDRKILPRRAATAFILNWSFNDWEEIRRNGKRHKPKSFIRELL